MKKIIYQISLILLVMTIGITAVFINKVNAADSIAGINCASSVNLGENFTVALILPSNAYAAEATVTIKYSDGSTSSTRLTYMQGMESSGFPNYVSFNAQVAGTATITASDIIISDSSANTIESGGTKSATISIVSTSSTTSTDTTTTTTTTTTSSTSSVTFTDVNETVYTTSSVNARKSYSTSSEIVITLSKNTQLTRTGVGSNGWSRISYNGQTVYISSQYLTTTSSSTTQDETEVTFTDVSETVYAIQDCNLRESWSTDSEKVGYLTAGQEVERTGIGDNGWSRINYNGQVVYVATRLLTTEDVEDESDTEEAEEDENVLDSDEMSEEEKLNLIQEEIGVLPEVGNNIAITFYIIITLIAIIVILIGAYYIKNNTRRMC